MYLFEFDKGNVTQTAFVALISQLEDDLDKGKIGNDFTVQELLDYFQRYDVILDVNDLYNEIKTPPLKGLIKNIQGDRVVFKGQKEDTVDKPATSDNDETVEKMAKRAMKENVATTTVKKLHEYLLDLKHEMANLQKARDDHPSKIGWHKTQVEGVKKSINMNYDRHTATHALENFKPSMDKDQLRALAAEALTINQIPRMKT